MTDACPFSDGVERCDCILDLKIDVAGHNNEVFGDGRMSLKGREVEFIIRGFPKLLSCHSLSGLPS